MECGRTLLACRPTVTRTSRRRRTLHLALCAAVLPALLLRALIPVGFMPVTDSGGVSIALCPGEAALPPALPAEMLLHHAGHAHGARSSGHSGSRGSAHHAPCLFATGGAAALTPATTALVLSVPAAIRVRELPQSGVFLPSILRAQAPRGPPASA